MSFAQTHLRTRGNLLTHEGKGHKPPPKQLIALKILSIS
jgi:hypothetical protein